LRLLVRAAAAELDVARTTAEGGGDEG